MYPRSMADSDCIVVMGSNMAENHPVAFRWPMKAKVENGAKLIHVDPRFTRTSANCDIHAPIRAGSDIAFLGGLINHVINSERWNTDPFFRTFVTHYTNAPTILRDDPYDVLGVGRGARESEIKAAFRRLAKECHPDRCNGDPNAERQVPATGTPPKNPGKTERNG